MSLQDTNTTITAEISVQSVDLVAGTIVSQTSEKLLIFLYGSWYLFDEAPLMNVHGCERHGVLLHVTAT